MNLVKLAMWIGIVAGVLTILHFLGYANPVGSFVASMVVK